MQKLTVVTLAVLVLAAPSLAGEAEDKFHAAYAKEVVEGDVKGAALEYLALMEDDAATDRLRAEARFRFAVCAVLLGRSDEARTHLTGLAEAEGLVPPDIRKKAEEYLASISGVGVGTELEKKLQSLVFDLGRVHPGGTVDVYRDFEIIGESALPFLRKLLNHSDVSLRQHAFRLLCRMGEPDMASKWSPAIGMPGVGFCNDLTNYLKARPAELAGFEKRIVELGDDGYRHVASMTPAPSFSILFVRTLSGTGKWERTAFRLLAFAGTKTERNDLLVAWLEGEDDEMSRRTASHLLSMGQRVPDAVATPDRFRTFLDRTIELGTNFQGSQRTTWRACLQRWLEDVPPETALAELERVMAYGESLEEFTYTNPVMAGLAAELAGRVEQALPDGVDVAKYAGLLKRWLSVQQRWYELLRARTNSAPQTTPDAYLVQRWSRFLELAPLADAKSFAAWIATLPADDRGRRVWAGMFKLRSPRGVEIFAVVVRAAPADLRPAMVYGTNPQRSHFTEDTSRAWMTALLTLTPELDANLTRALYQDYPRQSDRLPREEAKAHLKQVLGLLPKLSVEVSKQILRGVQTNPGFDYQTATAFPVFTEFWESIPEDSRRSFLGGLLGLVNKAESGGASLGDESEAVITFLRRHLGEISAQQLMMVQRHPHLFPPEEWIRYTQPSHPFRWHLVKQEERDRIATKLAEDLGGLNETEVKFIAGQTSEKVRRGIFERALGTNVAETRSKFIRYVSARGPVPLAVVEKTLATLLAEEPEDLSDIAYLAEIVLALRPSEKLFPVARLLLASENPGDRLAGIRIAKSLGREDLVPDLAKLLDSMDAKIRGAAKDAIDSIREVQRIKNEEAMKKAGVIPE